MHETSDIGEAQAADRGPRSEKALEIKGRLFLPIAICKGKTMVDSETGGIEIKVR
jgi:hypothetical protein